MVAMMIVVVVVALAMVVMVAGGGLGELAAAVATLRSALILVVYPGPLPDHPLFIEVNRPVETLTWRLRSRVTAQRSRNEIRLSWCACMRGRIRHRTLASLVGWSIDIQGGAFI